MLSKDMDPDHRNGFSNWLSEEWERCAAMTSAFENHAIMFLTTTNGGGAATLIAFAGSAGYATPFVYLTLACFIAGILLAGVTIITGYYRLRYITRGLGADHRAFNLNEISSSKIDANHAYRFKHFDWGVLFAWLSFAALFAGTVLGAITYLKFQQFKAEKEQQEKVKPNQDAVVNVSCIAPRTSQQPMEKGLEIKHQTKGIPTPKG